MQKKKNIWKGIRIACACVFFLGITLLLIDPQTLGPWLGWMACMQAWPALNNHAGNILMLIAIVLLTVLLGRVYCSIICPLGIMQDLFIWLGNRHWMKKLGNHLGPNRFRPSVHHKLLRYTVMALFIVLGMWPVTAAYAHILEPYSLYGKWIAAITSNGYSWIVYAVLIVMLIVISMMALLRGRLWCNTMCPVGSLLSILSIHPVWTPSIDAERCNGCQKCARNCKSECIDPKEHKIDTMRCVGCYDCLGECAQGAISLCFNSSFGKKPSAERIENQAKQQTKKEEAKREDTAQEPVDESKRRFLATAGVIAIAGLAEAKKKTDGGLAAITEKKVPARATRLVPAGARSLRHFEHQCTGCQLCISACPHQVLRPSMDLSHWMLPEMQFDRGYCPVTCHACSDICPTGALHLTGGTEKAMVQVGHAVWIKDNCVVLTDDVHCGNCARHCPTGAIQMVALKGDESHLVPAIDSDRCIGCGHCEYVCPSRPLSAIYVEGHEQHRII